MSKVLFYLGPLDLIGGATQDTSAIGILTKADFLIVANQVGAPAIATMTEVLRAVKLAKPTIKIFGYTDLGNALTEIAWEATVTAWITNTDYPTEKLIDGIFIDNFGFSFATSTRDNQNLAVTFVHGQTLSAMVSSSPVMNVINKYTGLADPVFGKSGTIKDYVCLDGFYFDRTLAPVTLVKEPTEKLFGRLDYVQGAKTTNSLNMGYIGVADMFTTITVPVTDYNNILDIANKFNMDAVGFAPHDYGQASHNYFLFKKVNDFTGP